MSLRVALYARYSSDLQSAASIEDQMRLCRQYAGSRGWEVVGTYDDAAVSGSTMLRAGMQRLRQDAETKRFDLVLCEALDRLSRSQADIAALYDRMNYLGVSIWTTADGPVNEMHIGLKGTINALYIKDLARKTHRGLEGRVKSGKSAGGNAFGYTVLRRIDHDGEVIRGDREINSEEADIVRQIFTAYAGGCSPNTIADQLNQQGIPGPRGGKWDKSTIHGNPKRGIGILNNELYIGRLVWNRQRFVKDPQTGKRQARPNPPEAWVTEKVPHLRIIAADLWEEVRMRQGGRTLQTTGSQAWEQRKPEYLLSGKVKCGTCGGGFSTVGKDRFGCSNSRNKGKSVCDNRTGITRQALEGRILTLLKDRLMDPDLVRLFAQEYVAERNRLASAHVDDRAIKEQQIAKLIKDQDLLVDAMLKSGAAAQIHARIKKLEDRQRVLEAELAQAPAKAAVLRIHPEMAGVWANRIGDLVAGLETDGSGGPAREAVRGLIEKIVANPVPTAGKRNALELTLHGDLAGILGFSLGIDLLTGQQKTSCEQEVNESVGFLVAGARNRRNLPRLTCYA